MPRSGSHKCYTVPGEFRGLNISIGQGVAEIWSIQEGWLGREESWLMARLPRNCLYFEEEFPANLRASVERDRGTAHLAVILDGVETVRVEIPKRDEYEIFFARSDCGTTAIFYSQATLRAGTGVFGVVEM